MAAADLSSTVLAERKLELDVDHSAAATLDAATALVDDVLGEADVEREGVVGVGLGLSGPIDLSGAVGGTVILPDWTGLDAGGELSRRLDLPVAVDNDANLGALAEASQGAGRGLTDVIYVMLSSGIGSGLVLGGRLHRGANGFAGELGHVAVVEKGAVCRCGNRGCLETVASTDALLELLRPTHGAGLTVARMLELVDAGDRAAKRVLYDGGRAVGRVLAGFISLIDPQAIVVGGELSPAGDPARRHPRRDRPLRDAGRGRTRRGEAGRARRPGRGARGPGPRDRRHRAAALGRRRRPPESGARSRMRPPGHTTNCFNDRIVRTCSRTFQQKERKVTKLPRTALAIVAVVGVATAAVMAASASMNKAAATAEICVLLPDSKSSVRWETQDRRFLADAFKRLGHSYSIVNAEGSASTQLNQAQQCLTNGAKVILLVNLDSGSGAAIQKAAVAKKAQVIDYDRLTLKGAASYYVSFNNVSVGKLQGQGLVNCLTNSGAIKKKPVVATLNGSPDRQQRDAVRTGLQLDRQPEVQERHDQEGAEPVGPGLGQPEGPDDLPGHAHPDQEQHPGCAGGE